MPDNDQEYDKESVNLWVDPERKARWKQFVDEESDFQYLSQLIRKAVEREIQQSDDDGKAVELSENVVGHFDNLQNSIAELEQVMQEAEKRLSGIEREVRDDPQVRQLANEVFEILPSMDEIKHYEIHIADGATPPEHIAPRAQAGTVEGIADSLDIEPHEVKAALDRLQQDTHQVHTTDWNGETRYYKGE
ncbi:hypothetical protein [Haloarchaeobius litoreus]|uniref:Uncharacterized protein n=1 Tax=Haloarchaeobius litoreus TaxID=755306 RepID=A0ABD6DFC7_9EURY|nr:hypothetical protein [Haloarchaeobius litoreus]